MLDDENEFLPLREEEVPVSLVKKWDEQEKREGLMQCRACGKQILAASSFCAYCGDPVGMPNRLWVVGVAVGLFILCVLFGARIFIHYSI